MNATFTQIFKWFRCQPKSEKGSANLQFTSEIIGFGDCCGAFTKESEMSALVAAKKRLQDCIGLIEKEIESRTQKGG